MSEPALATSGRSTSGLAATGVRFRLSPGLEAGEPPEDRGLARDEVRLIAAEPGRVSHHTFRDLPDLLAPGDLVVVNTSATVPAALEGRRPGGRPAGVHLATHLDDGTWVVELRRPDRTGPERDAAPGEVVELPGGALLRLDRPYDRAYDWPAAERTDRGAPPVTGPRLWRAALSVDGPPGAYLDRHGRPIPYAYLRGRWPLADYQTVFAREPGSAEMPSAGRPFTHRLVTRLVTAGVAVAPVTLHTGVSSLEPGERPQPERFRVPPATATLVERTRAAGGRVVAVGTTVTRALESVARPDGSVRAGGGWTDLVLGPDRPARVVDGLVTGWHAPEASHLLLLEAVAGAELVGSAYAEAVRSHYLWHEFGDSCLLLPDRRPSASARRVA